MTNYSKTKTSYYRRLYVAFLIDSGTNTVPALLEATEMHRRTLQDTLKALADLDIVIESRGGTKNASYTVKEWGAIDTDWIKNNLRHIKDVLELPNIIELNNQGSEMQAEQKKPNYEQIIYDQALHCSNEVVELFRKLRLLEKEPDSNERRRDAKNIEKKLSNVFTKGAMLEYMFDAAGREDLKELIFHLMLMTQDECVTAMVDPVGWKEACSVAKVSSERPVNVPDKAVRDWRLEFMSAINR